MPGPCISFQSFEYVCLHCLPALHHVPLRMRLAPSLAPLPGLLSFTAGAMSTGFGWKPVPPSAVQRMGSVACPLSDASFVFYQSVRTNCLGAWGLSAPFSSPLPRLCTCCSHSLPPLCWFAAITFQVASSVYPFLPSSVQSASCHGGCRPPSFSSSPFFLLKPCSPLPLSLLFNRGTLATFIPRKNTGGRGGATRTSHPAPW